MVIDAIYEPFEGYETKEDVLEYLSHNYFLDERDAKFFMSITETEHIYHTDHKHGITTVPMHMHSNTRTPFEFLEANYDKQYSLIEQYLVPQYKTIAELYD